jgi:hypothetical protein
MRADGERRHQRERVVAWLQEVPYSELWNWRSLEAKQYGLGGVDYDSWLARGRKIHGVTDVLEDLLREGEWTGEVDLPKVVMALRELGGKKSTPALVMAMGDESLPLMVRITATCSLGKIADRRAVEPLGGRALRDTDPNIRANACGSLAMIGGPRAKWYLEQARSDPDQFVAAAATEALREFGGRPMDQQANRRTRPRQSVLRLGEPE